MLLVVGTRHGSNRGSGGQRSLRWVKVERGSSFFGVEIVVPTYRGCGTANQRRVFV